LIAVVGAGLQIFLRLSHIFESGEHPTLSQPVNVSLADIFTVAGLKVCLLG
jgi:hypothetical protein